MGERQAAKSAGKSVGFNGSIKLRPAEQELVSDGGALMLREIEQRLGLLGPIIERLRDPRCPEKREISFGKLLICRLMLIMQGLIAQDDADKHRHNPAICAAVADGRGAAAIDEPLPSQPSLSRLLTALQTPENRAVLHDALLDMAIAAFPWRRPHKYRYLTLDLDSTDHETHGKQHGAAYNGHYKHNCLHPLIAVIAETHDLAGVNLRDGNVASQDGAAEFVLPLLARLKGTIGQITDVRADCAFAVPAVMDVLDTENIGFVMALRSNERLEKLAQPLIAERHEHAPIFEASASSERTWAFELEYAAKSWAKPRRVVLVVIERDDDEVFLGRRTPHHFFLVTNFSNQLMPSWPLLEHYRQRGTIEQSIGEFKHDLRPRLSSREFATNEVNLLLFGLAYQWLHIARELAHQAAPQAHRPTLATFRARWLHIAVRVLRHARQRIFEIAADAYDSWQRLFAFLDRRQTRLASRSPAPSPPS